MGKKKKEKQKEPEYYMSAINNKLLNYNVYYMKWSEKMLYIIVAVILGGVVGLVFYANLFMKDGEPTAATHISNICVFWGMGIFAAKMFLPMRTETLKKKRQSILRSQFREMLSSLSSSFASGANVMTAFGNAYNDMVSQYGEGSYITKELQEMNNGIANNISVQELLGNLANRSGLEDIANFYAIFNICFDKGGDMRNVVRNTYELIGEKISINEEVETKLTSNKMQQNVMSVVPIAMIAFLRFSSSSFAQSFAKPQGVIVMTAAVGIFIASYLCGRKIVDIKG